MYAEHITKMLYRNYVCMCSAWVLCQANVEKPSVKAKGKKAIKLG